MKWFKHFSDANTDDKLVSIRARFGLWGIGAYWTVAELVCTQMRPKKPKAEATLLLSELAASFGCKRIKLKSFLEHLQNIRGIEYTLEEDLLKIEMPRLLKSLDNYHSDFQVTSKLSKSVSTSKYSLAPSVSINQSEREGKLPGDMQVEYEEQMRKNGKGAEAHKVF